MAISITGVLHRDRNTIDPSGPVSAVAATGSGVARVPVVSGLVGYATVTGVRASGVGAAGVPAPFGSVLAFASASPPTTAAADTNAVSLGVEFYTDLDSTVSAVQFWQPATGGDASTRTVGIYRSSDGVLQGSTQTLPVVGSGWQTAVLPSPVPVARGVQYRAVVYHPAGAYAATSGYFTTGGLGSADEVVGVMHIPNNTDSLNGQGLYGYNIGIQFPTNTFGSTNYWTDFTLSAGPAGGGSYLSTGRGAAIAPSVSGGSTGTTASVSHGSALTKAMTGPWALQGVSPGSESLSALTTTQLAERISTYPGWGRPSWIPGTTYNPNDMSPSNVGGVVGVGGINHIGGYTFPNGITIPAGTWIAQFRDCSLAGGIVTGDSGGAGSAFPGVMFVGCRMRGAWTSPGWVNYNAESSGGYTWFAFCDAGGTSYVPPVCEGIFESQGGHGDRDHQVIIRSYLSVTTNLAGARNNGDAYIENFCENVARFYPDDTYHIGGLMNSGGQTATLWLRNNVSLSPQPGYPTNTLYKPQVSTIQMAADGPAYNGTGLNLEGSQGYQIRDNRLGGSDFTLQLGMDKANTPADVSNVVVTGNKFTTEYFTNSGNLGIAYKDPTWAVQGNTWSGNTWADDYGTGTWDPATGNVSRQYPAGNGPRTGTSITAPTTV